MDILGLLSMLKSPEVAAFVATYGATKGFDSLIHAVKAKWYGGGF